MGKHQVARWNGPPRSSPVARAAQAGPPRFDPTYLARAGEVETRPLDCYEGGALSGFAIEQIAEKARLILSIPSASTGCSWEIKKITENGWLCKTLLVMPPVVSKASAHFRDSWDITRAEWEKDGFELPPLSPLGAIFSYDSQKTLSYCIPFPHTAKALREALAR